MIEKTKEIGRKAGVSQEEIDNLIVVFDREGFSAELFRHLDGRDKADRKRMVIFVTWAKYTEKWVYDVADEKFDKEMTITYKIQEPKRIKYFETERVMNKYGKIRTIIVEGETDKRRCAIYTNAKSVRYTEVRCPNAARLEKRTFITLCHPKLEVEHMKIIAKAIKKVIRGCTKK